MSLKPPATICLQSTLATAAVSLLLIWPCGADAQDSTLVQEISRLKERVGQLESVLASENAQRPSLGSDRLPQQGASSGGMMEMMNSMMGGMQGMSGPRKGTVTSPSSLPGFPGLSHLYHVGATGFFLDHSQMLQLTEDQQIALRQVRDEALVERRKDTDRIRRLEGDLWRLTSQDTPDLEKIERAVRDLEKIRAERRIRFIRRVGQAAQVLSDRQRFLLLRGHGISYGDPTSTPTSSGTNQGTAAGMSHM